MECLADRVLVLPPGVVADAVVVEADEPGHAKPGVDLVSGHDVFLFVARGEGTYASNGRRGVLRPNTLLSAPAGAFSCDIRGEREVYVLTVREGAAALGDSQAFTPFFERRLSPVEGRFWRERMSEYVDRVARGRFTPDDVTGVKAAIFPNLWRRERSGARETLRHVFESIESRLAEPLSLERLAADVAYSPNYLNDLAREHTGLSLGRWVADMRMARARGFLAHTDDPVAEVAATCGFSDPAYFSRAFRRTHGVPPVVWRIASRPVDARYADVTMTIDDLHVIEESVHAAPTYSFAS